MRLKHVHTGNIGTFVETRNGYYGEVTIILLSDGRQYFAPSHEFKEVVPADLECLAHQLKLNNDFKIIARGCTKPPKKRAHF